jgi:hypothetical protein
LTATPLTCGHEAFRAGLGMVTAILLPLTMPALHERRLLRGLATAGLAIAALVPWLDRLWPAWCVVAASAGVAFFLPPRRNGLDQPGGLDPTDPALAPRDPDRGGEASAPTRLVRGLSPTTIGAGFGLGFLTAILLDYSVLTSLGTMLPAYSSVSLVTFGWLLATLVAGSAIERLVQPFTRELAEIMSTEATRSLKNAGRWIGLLERTLVYGALCAGRPDAVLIVVTIKSIARFPQFKTEAFAEYYLVGTLLSLLAALTLGAAVRVLLCWPAIPMP